MESTARFGTARIGAPQNCVSGIKTGTAQTGVYDENGEEIEKALDEETDTEEETADDSYETAEIAGEDVEAAQKTTGDSSQDDLRKQHIKTTALVAGIVVLLILLLLLPMRKNRRLRKGDRGEGEEDR